MTTTEEIKITQYNLKVAKAFLKAYPNAKLFPCVWRGKHVPQIPWSRRATGMVDVLEKWAKFFVRHQILPKKKGKRDKPCCVVTKRPRAVYFCVASKASGFQIVDVDDKNGKDGNESLKDLEELPRTLSTSTPSGNGRHFIYFGGPIKCKANSLGEGVDTVGMVPVPGSNAHPKGIYKITDKTYARQAPAWIEIKAGAVTERPKPEYVPDVEPDLEHNVHHARTYLTDEAKRPAEGERDTVTYAVACRVRDFAISEEKCFELMIEDWLPLCDEAGDWSESDIASKIDSAYRNAASPMGAATAESAFGVYQEVQEELKEEEEEAEPLSKLVGKPPVFKFVNGKGKPTNRIDNLRAIMVSHNIRVRYNEMSKAIEYAAPVLKGKNTDHIGEVVIAELEDLCTNYGMSSSSILRYLKHIASAESFHPIKEWLARDKWDGKSRLQAFLDTLTVPPTFSNTLKETLMKRWLVSGIAAIYEPIFSARGVLVLQGRQRLGKTSWGRSLCPPDAFLEGAILDPRNKDSIMASVSRWVVELGELDATFRQADLARLKAFITNREDVLRVPFAVTNSRFARRTIFMASVNSDTFLQDSTGNSRWWSIPCKDIHFNHGINMRQLWLEVRDTLYKRNYSWHLEQEDNIMLTSSNMEFEEEDVMELSVKSTYNFESDKSIWMALKSTGEICDDAGVDKFRHSNLIKMGKACKKLFESKRTNQGTKYFVPPLLDDDEELNRVFGEVE